MSRPEGPLADLFGIGGGMTKARAKDLFWYIGVRGFGGASVKGAWDLGSGFFQGAGSKLISGPRKVTDRLANSSHGLSGLLRTDMAMSGFMGHMIAQGLGFGDFVSGAAGVGTMLAMSGRIGAGRPLGVGGKFWLGAAGASMFGAGPVGASIVGAATPLVAAGGRAVAGGSKLAALPLVAAAGYAGVAAYRATDFGEMASKAAEAALAASPALVGAAVGGALMARAWKNVPADASARAASYAAKKAAATGSFLKESLVTGSKFGRLALGAGIIGATASLVGAGWGMIDMVMSQPEQDKFGYILPGRAVGANYMNSGNAALAAHYNR